MSRRAAALPLDRAFALVVRYSGFDPAAPHWLQKHNFMCLIKTHDRGGCSPSSEPRTGRLASAPLDGPLWWRRADRGVACRIRGFLAG